MKPVKAGDLKHWLKLSRLTEVSDEFGGANKKPVLFDSRWGCVKPVSAWKATQSKQIQMPVTHSIIMRHSVTKPVTADCQIEWVDMSGVTRLFSVTHIVNVDERNRLVTVEAEERPNNPDTA